MIEPLSHEAALTGRETMLKLLLGAGADPNYQGRMVELHARH